MVSVHVKVFRVGLAPSVCQQSNKIPVAIVHAFWAEVAGHLVWMV